MLQALWPSPGEGDSNRCLPPVPESDDSSLGEASEGTVLSESVHPQFRQQPLVGNYYSAAAVDRAEAINVERHRKLVLAAHNRKYQTKPRQRTADMA
jgi:hypothetical protein